MDFNGCSRVAHTENQTFGPILSGLSARFTQEGSHTFRYMRSFQKLFSTPSRAVTRVILTDSPSITTPGPPSTVDVWLSFQRVGVRSESKSGR